MARFDTKWWIGAVVLGVTSTVATIGWAKNMVTIDISNHRVHEQHEKHPSKDSFEEVKNNIADIKKKQEEMIKTEQRQSLVIQRIADKLKVEVPEGN